MRKRHDDPFMFFIILMLAFLLFSEEHEDKLPVDSMVQSQQVIKANLSSKEEIIAINFKIQYDEVYEGYTGVGAIPRFYEGEVKLSKKDLGENGLPTMWWFPQATSIFFSPLNGTKYCLSVPVISVPKVVAALWKDSSRERMLVLAEVEKQGENIFFISSRFATRQELKETNKKNYERRRL